MLNWMTLHQVLKMVTALCYIRLNTKLRVVLPFKCWPSPVGCCLSSLLWCEVPPSPLPCTLAASGSRQEKKFLDIDYDNRRGQRFFLNWFCLAVEQWLARWKRTSLWTICWEKSKILTYCVGMNRQCYWSKVHLFPIIHSRIRSKNVPGVLYEFKHKKRRR